MMIMFGESTAESLASGCLRADGSGAIGRECEHSL
jgi:hypothetical protein